MLTLLGKAPVTSQDLAGTPVVCTISTFLTDVILTQVIRFQPLQMLSPIRIQKDHLLSQTRVKMK